MSDTPPYEPVKYHDGQSPSAWAMSIGGMIGAVIIALGFIWSSIFGHTVGLGGPNWIVVIIGVVVVVVAGIIAMVQSRRGLSNRVR